MAGDNQIGLEGTKGISKKMKLQVDRAQNHLEFQVKDQVWLSMQNINLIGSRKL